MTEVLLFTYAASALLRPEFLGPYTRPVIFKFGPALVLWMFSQALSDIVTNTDFATAFAAQANIAFLYIDLIALSCLIVTMRSLVIGASSTAVGLLLGTGINPAINFPLDPWKFGFAFPSAILLLVFAAYAYHRGKFVFPTVTLIAFATLNLILGYRSLSAIFLVGAIAAIASVSRNIRRRGISGESRTPLTVVVSAIVVACIVFLFAYSEFANNGVLGAGAQDKYVNQAGGEYGVLVGGRKEVVGMAISVGSSPVFGAGSAGALDRSNLSKTLKFYRDAGYAVEPTELRYLSQQPLPAHSAAIGAAFNAGVLALLFWVLVVRQSWRSWRQSLATPLSGPTTIVFSSTLSSILFSPLGADQRFMLALSVVGLTTLATYRAKSDAGELEQS